MTDRSSEWVLASQRSGQTLVVAQFFFGDGTKYLPLSSGPLRLEGEDYLPLIAEMPERTATADYWTREFSVSDISLSILNSPFEGDTRFSDLLDVSGSGNDRGYTNRRIVVSLWKSGVTTFANCQPLFTGIFRKPPYNAGTVTVNIEDESTLTLNVILPKVSGAATIDLGKVDPLIGGSHKYLKGNDSKSLDTVTEIHNGVKCVYLGLNVAGTKHRWRVSKHKLHEIDITTAQEDFWIFDINLNRSVRLKDVTIEQNDVNGCIIQHDLDPTLIDYFYAVDSTAARTNKDSITNIVPITRVRDKDFSLAATGTMTPGGLGSVVAGDFTEITALFNAWENQNIEDSAISQVLGYYYGKLTYGDTASDNDVVIRMESDNLGLVSQTIKPSGGAYPDARIPNDAVLIPATKTGISDGLTVRLEMLLAITSPETITFDVYEIYKSIAYTLGGELLTPYFTGLGGQYGTWINDRTGHADNNQVNTLIQNPIGLIEWYLRDTLGVSTDKINLERFNTASVVRSSVEGAISITEDVNTLEELFLYAQNYDCFMWWDATGKVSILALADDYTTPDKVIDGDLITDLEYGRTDAERLYTAVEVEYSGYEDIGKPTTPQVEDATAQLWNNVTAEQTDIVFPSIGYKEESDAINFGDGLLGNYKNIHNTIACELPTEFNDIDIGTILGFKNIPLTERGEDLTQSYTIGGQTIRPFFLVIEALPSNGIKFLAAQIHKRD